MKPSDRFSWSTALAIGAASLVALEMGTKTNPASAQIAPPVISQSLDSLATCKAPGSNEYLLLVVLQTDEAQRKLLETLPPSVQAPTCNYLGSRVARMGGFQKPEDADAWASYLRDVASLPAFVAKPTQRTVSSLGSATQIQDPAGLVIPTANAGEKPSALGSSQAQATSPPQSPPSGVPSLGLLPPPVIPAQPRAEAKVDVPQVGSPSTTPLISNPANVPTALPKPIPPSSAQASIVTPPTVTAPRVTSPPAVSSSATAESTTPAAVSPPLIAQASATPPAVPTPTVPTPKTPPAETFSVASYEPKVLSNGYVVLVDYGNRTSLVSLLRQRTNQPVGLASYGQRPFLMVSYTPNSKAALTTLSSLNAMGFRTLLVDASQVTLLTPDVQVK